ncbi:MAG: hypothetical protein ACI8RD_005784 [Bacillariaceae sp.]|jgi:hypothetical protein
MNWGFQIMYPNSLPGQVHVINDDDKHQSLL